MKRSGYADLPLHYGKVPPWLAGRMAKLGGAIVEALIIEYGKAEVVKRMSDPAWFQALGCVMGMDWHSSGITTSVIGALKKALNPKASELGIYVCGGRGRFSRNTPSELLAIAEKTGLNGNELVKNSRLVAKVDNTAIQDGFQIYLHSFILSDEGDWSVVQQGLNGHSKTARRYHWHSKKITSFTEEPHTFIYGQNQGEILNLTDKNAAETKKAILGIAGEDVAKSLAEIKKLVMPAHHDVRQGDVNLKRLGAILAASQNHGVNNFEDFLLLEGCGPRTLQSLTLVSEVIYGTPSRFNDPARYSFAHGGKDGHPFPVPTKVYDETIAILEKSISKAKLGETEKQEAIKKLHETAKNMEKDFEPTGSLKELINVERRESYQYGGRTVFGKAQPRHKQLSLF